MPAVVLGGRAIAVALAALELLVLLLRVVKAPARREIGRLALQIVVAAVGVFLPPVAELRGAYFLALVWSAGLHAAGVSGGLGAGAGSGGTILGPWTRRMVLWHASNAGALLALGLLRQLVGSVLLPLLLLFCFLASVLASFPIGLLAGASRGRRSSALLLYAIVSGLLLAAQAWDVLSAARLVPAMPAAPPVTAAYLGVVFVLLAREPRAAAAGHTTGFLFGPPEAQERRLQQAYSRIVQTEHSLLVQDHLVAAGVLAAGAAHEFKNTLSCILATVDHGLRSPVAATESLQLAREHALQGQRAVSELLEGLVRHGREKPQRFVLLQSLAPFLEIVRAAFRREGIRLELEIPEALEVRIRKGELEQVLLSLIRNAADSVRAHGRNAEGAELIVLRARRLEESVVIDVVDSGGGVPEVIEPRLFELAVSDKNSTGVGLYLAGTLAERNGGNLSYIPVDGGSCFRLTLPIP